MSLATLLEMAAAGHGDRVAWCDAHETVTFSDLADRAARLATLVRESRARHVVLLARNGPLVPQVLFAAAYAGVPFVPLNYRLSSDQIREQVARVERPLVVAEDRYASVLAGLADVRTSARLKDAVGTCEPSPPTEGSPVAVMLFTSGTTSRPKIVALRHTHLFAYVAGTVELSAASPQDAALVTVPPYHVAGLGATLSNTYAGRRVVYLPDFEATEWLRLASAERVTSAMLVPTMLSRIVDHADGHPTTLPALRQITYGGARMPAPLLEKALSAFPTCGFVNAYGLTETSSTVALLTPDDHRSAIASADPAVRARLDSVGRAVPGIELEVRDTDGRPLPAGQVGELWVRGAQVSGEYVETGSALDGDGWFPTRDRAHLDEDGYLFVEGRTDDTIIRGGENIAPAEIEDVLGRHPAVADSVVVGLPDTEWGQRIVAVVVRSAGHRVDVDELRSWVRGSVRGSRTPDEIVWRDALPYTPTGKVLRRDLVAELSGAAGVTHPTREKEQAWSSPSVNG